MKISNSLCQILNSIHSSNLEHIVLQDRLYPTTPPVQFFHQLSSLTIAYTNPGFNSSSLTFSVPMSDNFRPSSHHTFLCRFYYSPFLKRWIFLEMCLVCLVFLPFFSIHTSYFLSNIIRGYCSRTTYGSFLGDSLFIVLKCARVIPVVHSTLYSLPVLYW